MIVRLNRPLARSAAGTRSAFTLLEVLVVVAILVILAGVASISVLRYLDDAKISKAKLDIKTLEQACKAYALKYNENPSSLAQLVSPSQDGGRPFIEGGQAVLIDPWGQPYNYNSNDSGEKPLISTTHNGQVISNTPQY